MITRRTFVAGQAGLVATLAAGGATAFALPGAQRPRAAVRLKAAPGSFGSKPSTGFDHLASPS